MLSRQVLAQLGQLNRTRTPVVTAPTPLRTSPASDSRATPSAGLFEPAAAEPLDRLPDGREITTRWGTHWLRQVSLREFNAEYQLGGSRKSDRPQRRAPVTQSSQASQAPHTAPSDERVTHHAKRSRQRAELQALANHFPRGMLFLDLETCGFAGSMVFLIGLIHYRHSQLVVSQLLARHYGEERSILQSLCDVAASHDNLATFNGKSFDWPMVRDRLTVHRLDDQLLEPTFPSCHCDLLHHARRRWRGQLPDCKLQTLERLLFGRRRVQDVAGREIPEAYHDFVRTGDAWLMRRVLHHNALDLVTLLQLSWLLISRSGADE